MIIDFEIASRAIGHDEESREEMNERFELLQPGAHLFMFRLFLSFKIEDIHMDHL